MEISAPLLNKIIKTNQLIKGRLNVNNSDLKNFNDVFRHSIFRIRNHSIFLKWGAQRHNRIPQQQKTTQTLLITRLFLIFGSQW